MINKYTINRKKLHDMIFDNHTLDSLDYNWRKKVDEMSEDAIFCIDAENNRFWFESIGKPANPYEFSKTIEALTFWAMTYYPNEPFVYGENLDVGMKFCEEILNTKRDIDNQLLDGMMNNINDYKEKLKSMDEDYKVDDNKLASAIGKFLYDVSEYLDNNNIYRYSWGEKELVDIAKGFARVKDKVDVTINGHTVPIELAVSQDKNIEDIVKEGINCNYANYAIAQDILSATEYYLCHDEVVDSTDSLYKIANSFNSYEHMEEKLKHYRFELAKGYVETVREGKQLWTTFSDEFKDLFGHRPRATEDYKMLANLYEQDKQSGDLEPDIDEER